MNFTKRETDLTLNERNKLIADWRQCKLELDLLKKREKELRDVIVEELFDTNVEEGTENIDLGEGYFLKLTKKLNYTLDKDNDKVVQALSQLNPEVSKRLVKWSSKLTLKEYKENITGPERAVINEVLTIKEAAPVLTLVSPKV